MLGRGVLNEAIRRPRATRTPTTQQVEGTIQIEEVAGAGSTTIRVLDERIYAWDAALHGSFPTKATFRYRLPDAYLDPEVGSYYPLPPTYAEMLHGMPGFSVRVAYAIVVNLTLLRGASTLWRGVSTYVTWVHLAEERVLRTGLRARSMRVPFRYSTRTRPLRIGPFPRSSSWKSEERPKTVFRFHMRAVNEDVPPIKVQVSA